jgi:hypothetical protein
MISKTKRVDLGIYAIVINGNYDFLKLNKSLFAFRYKMDITPLDEFERKFGDLFELGRSSDRLQDIPVNRRNTHRKSETIYISKAFYEKILSDYPQYRALLEEGYVVLLKTFKSFFLPGKEEIESEEVRKNILKSYEFVKNFRKCLELSADRSLQLGEFFGYDIGQHSIIRYRDSDHSYPAYVHIPGAVEDSNRFLEEFLHSMHPKPEYLELAIKNFLKSGEAGDYRLRFIQLLITLDVCMNGSYPDPLSQITVRNTAMLLSSDKEEFREYYEKLGELYKIRNGLIYEDLPGASRSLRLEEVRVRTEWLDNCVRSVLIKLIQLDFVKKNNLLDKLNLSSF